MKISNTTGADIDLRIEPLGDRLSMPRGDTFEIMAANDSEHEVEIEFRQDAVVVHGWVKRIHSISTSGERTALWPIERSV